MSQIVIIGNLAADPQLRFTKSGKPVASFTVGVNRKRGEQEETDWYDVTAWDSLGENVAQLAKGTRVIVCGRMQSRRFEDRDGNKRTAWEITADGTGPDLRFATAQVTRAQHASTPTSSRTTPQTGTGDPWADSGPQTGADGWAAGGEETPF